MAEPGVGFEFPPRKVSWLKRDVLLFNVSIGCKADEPQFVYVRFLLQLGPSVVGLTRWECRRNTATSPPFQLFL